MNLRADETEQDPDVTAITPDPEDISLEAHIKRMGFKRDAIVITRMKTGNYVVATIRPDLASYNRNESSGEFKLAEEMINLAGQRTLFRVTCSGNTSKNVLGLRGFGYVWRPFHLYNYGDTNVSEPEDYKYYIC